MNILVWKYQEHVFTPAMLIDYAISVIWVSRYQDTGDFELYLPASRILLEFFAENTVFLTREDRPEQAMKVEKIQMTSDPEDGKRLIISGRSAECILEQRIVMAETTYQNFPAETIIYGIVDSNAIQPYSERRKISELYIQSGVFSSERISVQYDGESLLEAAVDVCGTSGFGFRFIFDGERFGLEVYQGLDRTRFQTERTPVIFSPDHENILSTEFLYDKTTYANSIQLLAEKHPSDPNTTKSKTHYTVVESVDITGLDLYEKTVQAESASPSDGSEEISWTEYIRILSRKAHDALYKAKIKKEFSGETIETGMYQYGTDYDLGDKVSVVDESGIEGTAIVSEISEIEDENGYRLVPTFADWKVIA